MKTLTSLAIWCFNNQTGSILVHIYTLIYINLRVKYGSNLIRTLQVKIKNMKKEHYFFRGHVGRQEFFLDIMTRFFDVVTVFDVMIYFGCHDALFDAMTHFWTSWRVLDVMTCFGRQDAFLTSWRIFWRHGRIFWRHDVFWTSWRICLTSWRVLDVMTLFLTSWRVLDAMTHLLTSLRTF